MVPYRRSLSVNGDIRCVDLCDPKQPIYKTEGSIFYWVETAASNLDLHKPRANWSFAPWSSNSVLSEIVFPEFRKFQKRSTTLVSKIQINFRISSSKISFNVRWWIWINSSEFCILIFISNLFNRSLHILIHLEIFSTRYYF